MFVEVDRREHDGISVSLEWDRATRATQIVVEDSREASSVVLRIPNASAADAFHHPFRYVP